MSYTIDFLRKFMNKNGTSLGEANSSELTRSARKFLNRYSDKDIENINFGYFTSGIEFVEHLTSSTGVDDFNFSFEMSKINDMDLSSEFIFEHKEDSENADFYSIMEEIYSHPLLMGAIDSNNDGEISNEEGQAFLKEANNLDNSNKNVFTLNDFANLIDNLKEENDSNLLENAYGASGASGTSSVPSSYSGSQNYNYNASGDSFDVQNSLSLEQQKTQLEEQISGYQNDISNIDSNEAVVSAIKQRDDAKSAMDKAIQEDEKASQEAKDAISNATCEIQRIDGEISSINAQIASLQVSLASGQNKLSTLQSALSSLASPSNNPEDEELNQQLEQRREDLQNQITEQEKANAEFQRQIDELNQKLPSLQEEKTIQEKIIEDFSNQFSIETQSYIEAYAIAQDNIEVVKQQEIEKINDKIATAQAELQKVENEIETKKNKESESTFTAGFEEMLAHLFESEGGYVNDPDDRGGATNYGITQATYDDYCKSHGLSRQAVKNITKEVASKIYYENYFLASGADKYLTDGNAEYAYVLFDSAVNHGVGAAKKLDQKANGDPQKLIKYRAEKYNNIIANNPSQAKFRKGWQNRLNRVALFIDPNHTYTKYLGAAV